MKKYINDTIKQYIKENNYPWHMPGHKRKGNNIHLYDFTEVNGLDDYHHPTDMIQDSLKQLTTIYHTDYSKYLINGSTSGILASISSLCKHNDTIIIADNCHKSVHNAIKLLELDAYSIPIQEYTPTTIKQSIDIKDIQTLIDKLIQANKTIKACVITSPTYEGIVSNVKDIASLVHTYHIPLIVDSAHGAHFHFSDYFPDTAYSQNADIVIESLHKTLPCITQTAIIHVSNQVFPNLSNKVNEYLSIFQSSSPSYIMMANMEEGIINTYNRSIQGEYDLYYKRLINFRNKLKQLKYIELFEDPNAVYDISRIVLLTNKANISGTMLLDKLQEHHLVMEMAGIDYVIAISTIEDTEEDFNYFYEVLENIDQDIHNLHTNPIDLDKYSIEVEYFNETHIITINQLIELVNQNITITTSQLLYIYPPGIPLLTKGERFTKDKVNTLIQWIQYNKYVEGVTKHE